MKRLFLLSLFVVAFVAFTSCSDDEDVNNPPTDPAAYTNANGLTGGIMYDKFWSTEAGFN